MTTLAAMAPATERISRCACRWLKHQLHPMSSALDALERRGFQSGRGAAGHRLTAGGRPRGGSPIQGKGTTDVAGRSDWLWPGGRQMPRARSWIRRALCQSGEFSVRTSDFDLLQYIARFGRDTLDSANFPHSGQALPAQVMFEDRSIHVRLARGSFLGEQYRDRVVLQRQYHRWQPDQRAYILSARRAAIRDRTAYLVA